MARTERREILDDEPLTQYGYMGVFRNALRVDILEPELSLLAGRLTGAEAGAIVRNDQTVIQFPEGHGARHTTAGTLRAAGFMVFHSPSKKNPRHVSAQWPESWDDRVSEAFDECFEPESGQQ